MPRPTPYDDGDEYGATEYVYLTEDAEYTEAMNLAPSWMDYDTSDDYDREEWDTDEDDHV